MTKRTSVGERASVFFDAGWLCAHCRRPLVFEFALKRFGAVVEADRPEASPPYWAQGWSRDRAPLLNELAAVLDHTDGDPIASCAACKWGGRSGPMRDSDRQSPDSWDGLTTIFLSLAEQPGVDLSSTEQEWVRVLKQRLK